MAVRDFLALFCATALVSACATRPDEPQAAPDYTRFPDLAMTDNGRLVVACVEQALDAGHYHRISDGEDSGLIRFVCSDDAAEALFVALGPRSAEIGSEFEVDGVLHRSSERVQTNLYGVDLCRRMNVGITSPNYRCEINLNLGGFINE